MQISTMMPRPSRSWDLVAFDTSHSPVLLAEVKGVRPASASITIFMGALELLEPTIPFGLLADPKNLRFFRRRPDGRVELVATVETGDVLRHYDPEYSAEMISADYLTALLDAWLADLARHWHSSEPPISGEMARIGLLPRLADGTIEREVDLVSHRLR